MENIEQNDIVGNYKIKGKVLTLEAIAEQFFFASFVPKPLLLTGKLDQPYYDKMIHQECFATALAMQKVIGGKVVYSFVCGLDSEGSSDLKLTPHGIIIKDKEIIDPINYNISSDREVPYLIPKRIIKPKLIKLVQGNFITLSKEEFDTLFPTCKVNP